MDTIVKLSPKQRSELFRETAARKGITNAIAEKDFWVTWVLSKIFSDPQLSTLIIFKGRTSLSKAFHLRATCKSKPQIILSKVLSNFLNRDIISPYSKYKPLSA
jgi:hypothetical protein